MTARAQLYRRLPVTADLTWWQAQVAAAPGRTVLYLGAGTGRLAVPLARQAHRLVAVEPDPSMLAELRAVVGAAPHGRRIEVVDGHAAGAGVTGTFGCVLAPSQLLNEILDPVERAATVGAMRRFCHPQGRVLLQVLNPYWAARAPTTRGRLVAADGADVTVEVSEHAFEPWEQRQRARVTYGFADGQRCDDRIEAAALFPAELARLVADAGLAIVERWGARPGTDPITDEGASWHLVCTPGRPAGIAPA